MVEKITWAVKWKRANKKDIDDSKNRRQVIWSDDFQIVGTTHQSVIRWPQTDVTWPQLLPQFETSKCKKNETPDNMIIIWIAQAWSNFGQLGGPFGESQMRDTRSWWARISYRVRHDHQQSHSTGAPSQPYSFQLRKTLNCKCAQFILVGFARDCSAF